MAFNALAMLSLFFGEPASRLAIIETAPAFELVDARGKTLRSEDLRGKVVLVGFVFTTCNGSCPATTHRMAKIHDAIAARADLKDRIRFATITLDPERDRPESLLTYARLFEVDSPSWSFLSGSPETVRKTIADWGMWAKPTANGQIDHPSRVFLVDPKGRIREIYNLDFFRTPWVLADIEELAKRP